jgi:hypothetical protein
MHTHAARWLYMVLGTDGNIRGYACKHTTMSIDHVAEMGIASNEYLVAVQ